LNGCLPNEAGKERKKNGVIQDKGNDCSLNDKPGDPFEEKKKSVLVSTRAKIAYPKKLKKKKRVSQRAVPERLKIRVLLKKGNGAIFWKKVDQPLASKKERRVRNVINKFLAVLKLLCHFPLTKTVMIPRRQQRSQERYVSILDTHTIMLLVKAVWPSAWEAGTEMLR